IRLDIPAGVRDIALSTNGQHGRRGILMSWRRLTAVVGLVVVAAAAAVLLASGSTNTSSKTRQVASPRLSSMHERDQGNGEGDAAEAASQAYTDRAYPAA